jgi:hypothetical protein
VADDHDGLAIQPRPAADDRGVFPIQPVAMQLDEIAEHRSEIVVREGPLVRACHLNALKGREVPVNFLAQLRELSLERRDLQRHIELAIARELFQLVDLALELENGFFKVQGGRGHRDMLGPSAGADEMHPVRPEQSP